MLFRKDKNILKEIKSDQFKINGELYFIKSVLKRLFAMKTEKVNSTIINQEKQDKILKDGNYKNKEIIKEIPEDLKQVTEYNGRLLKDCYYYSDNNFKLYHKIDNTNLYFELKNYKKITTYKKKFKIKTIDNKSIDFPLYSKDAPISMKPINRKETINDSLRLKIVKICLIQKSKKRS